MTLFEEVVAAFTCPQVNIDDLPTDDPRVELGQTCADLFTNGVDVLRSIIPNERVRALARIVWDLVGHKQVLVAIGADVPSLTFTVMQREEMHQGIVLIPAEWPQMTADDPFMQLGAILFVGAQIVDFYNDRLIGDKGSEQRWRAYEAELLRTLKTTLTRWQPNAYQREVLARCPEGLDSKGVELYPLKPYTPSQGDA